MSLGKHRALREAPEEGKALRADDVYVEQLPLQRGVAVEDHDLIATRAADHLRASVRLPPLLPTQFDQPAPRRLALTDQFALALHEHFNRLADHLAVVGGGGF